MKKIISVLTLIFMLVGLASCGKDNHAHKYDNGVVTTDSLCGGNKTIKYSCTECEYSYSKTYEVEHNWIAATCTEPKKCSICNETDGEALGHSYEDNKCKRCTSVISIEVTLPTITETTPVEIKNFIGGSESFSINITHISTELDGTMDDNIKLTVTLSGEKNSDAISADASSTATLIYKLYSEDGAVVTSGTFTTPHLKVGDSFADKQFTISGLKNGQKYTLVLENYYMAN